MILGPYLVEAVNASSLKGLKHISLKANPFAPDVAKALGVKIESASLKMNPRDYTRQFGKPSGNQAANLKTIERQNRDVDFKQVLKQGSKIVAARSDVGIVIDEKWYKKYKKVFDAEIRRTADITAYYKQAKRTGD